MTARDARTGRFTVATSNAAQSSEGGFETMTDLPVEIQGADPADLVYAAEPRHAPDADTLAGPSYPSRLRPRDAVLYGGDDGGHAQGAILRAAARLSGHDGMIGHILGLYPPAAPSQDADDTTRPRTARRLPSTIDRADIDQRDR